MTLSSGARVGPYTITSPLGGGGMGEVYRAHDARLRRDVALKVVADRHRLDPRARERFEREGLALAAVNHPNIATVHGVEDSGGIQALVMELVEGESLADRMARAGLQARVPGHNTARQASSPPTASLPVTEVLSIARQVADALEAAHERGIIHRDLKPSNIMIRPDGTVKVVDFGLAKPLASSPAAGVATVTLTADNELAGTSCYMSPEQLRGHSVDARADIWAFGCVLYELLTGRRAFDGPTTSDIVAAVLDREPDYTALPAATPAAVHRLLRRCLVKDSRHRLRDIGDARLDLDEAPERAAAAEKAPRRSNRGRLAAAGIILAMAAVAGALVQGRRGSPAAPTLSQLTFRQGTIGKARFAPDGQGVVYGAAWDGEPFRLYSTRFGSSQSRAIDLPPADLLAFSSQGTLAISMARPAVDGFEPHGVLAVTPLAGGAPRPMFDEVVGADWAPNGKTMALVRRVGGRGARLEFPVGTAIHESILIVAPRVSPDGSRVCFFADNYGSLWIGDHGGSARLLATGLGRSDRCAWAPNGEEVWVAAGGGMHMDLVAIDLSGRRRTLASYPNLAAVEDIAADGKVLLASGILRFSAHGIAQPGDQERDLSVFDATRIFALDRHRALLWDNGPAAGLQRVFVRPLDGTPAVPLGPGAPAALSPDGRWAAVIGDGVSNQRVRNKLTLYPLDVGAARTVDVGIDMEPYSSGGHGRSDWTRRGYGFSLDGNRLLIPFGSAPNRPPRVYVYDLARGRVTAISDEGVAGPAALSPDGRLVAVNGPAQVTLHDVENGSRTPLPGDAELGNVLGWSTDGQALFLLEQVNATARLFRRQVRTGERTFVREIRAHDPAGVTAFDVWIANDGQTYAYQTYRRVTNLYVVEGLR